MNHGARSSSYFTTGSSQYVSKDGHTTFAEIFRTRTRDEWAEIFEPAEACTTPVLGLFEAERHRHNVARDGFIQHDGMTVPAPAPRFSRSHPQNPKAAGPAGGDTDEVLRAAGYTDAEVKQLRERGALT